jgi:hypothetical protein
MSPGTGGKRLRTAAKLLRFSCCCGATFGAQALNQGLDQESF